MENSIGEDIKNIEEIIELSKEEIDAKSEDIIAILDIEDLISLEHILSDYKKNIKENEKLRKQLNEENKRCMMLAIEKQDYFEKYRYNLQQNESLTKEFSNVIPVQKVKDKIRKNEEIIDISNDGDLIHELFQKNKVYEELLESAEKNEAIRRYNFETIPIKKVKDKIEELNQYYEKEIYPSLYQWGDKTITEHYDEMIGLLQELLGDK